MKIIGDNNNFKHRKMQKFHENNDWPIMKQLAEDMITLCKKLILMRLNGQIEGVLEFLLLLMTF